MTFTGPGVGAAPYRWIVLSVGTAAQASISAVQLGVAVLVPQLRTNLGLTLGETGVVLAAFSLGTTVTLMGWGLLADRRGERVTLSVGLAATAIALTGAAFAHSFIALVVSLTAAGAFSAGVVAAGGRAVMQWFPEAERGLALGIRQASVPAGGLLASFALPALANVGLGWAFGSLAATCVAGAVAGAWLLREPGVRAPAHRAAKTFGDRTLWLISFSTALLVVGQVATMSFTVLFLHAARGFSVGQGAAVYAGTLLLGLGLRVVVGHWSDRLGTRIVPLRRLALGVGATLALVALLVAAPTWLLILALLLAGGIGHSWAGLPFVLAAERAGTTASGAAIGLQQTAAGIGGIFGPIAFASVVAASSWRAAFLLTGVFPLIAWATLRPLARREASPSALPASDL